MSAGLSVYYNETIRQPLDLRVETPPERLGADRGLLRAVIAELVAEMDRRRVPVRAVIGASHNTNPFGDCASYQAQTLGWVVRHARELAAGQALAFTPASFAAMRAAADRVGSW